MRVSSKPVLSIVLGTFNRIKFLKATIANIRRHKIDVPYEIIVIDGGSKDGSIRWLARQRDILSIIQHNRGNDNKPRKSWGYFINLGFKNARGKYVLMLSDDCLLIPGSVMNGFNLFESKLAVGENIGAIAFYWRNWPKDKKYHVKHVPHDWVIHVNHGMYLREVLHKVGYIDEENYQFYYGDLDLSCRIKQAGYEIIKCSTAIVEHHEHANVEIRGTNDLYRTNDSKAFYQRWGDVIRETGRTRTSVSYLEYHDPANTVTQFPEGPTLPAPPGTFRRRFQIAYAPLSLYIRSNLAKVKRAFLNLISQNNKQS